MLYDDLQNYDPPNYTKPAKISPIDTLNPSKLSIPAIDASANNYATSKIPQKKTVTPSFQCEEVSF
jgi:hypothetical protein